MARKLGVGVIGCGNISTAYFKLAPLFKGIEMRACADINMDAAKARAKEFGLRAETVGELLAAKDIDIIVNLTIPAVHYEVSRQVLDAGKHVYSEKPFVLSVKEGLDLRKRAEKGKLRIGSAPDTFLGGAHQLARHLIDNGSVGKITSGSCFVMSHGMEHWHPNPGLLLPAGRRPGSRHRPLLCRQPDPADRSGEAGGVADQHAADGAHHFLQAAGRREDPGEDADHHPRHARIRQRRGR